MTRKNRALLGLAAFLALLVIFYLGQTTMGWFQNDTEDLRNLLTPKGAVLADDAKIKAWQPDRNYKPQNYYLIRSIDETGFQDLARQVGLSAAPATDQAQAIWRLPPGVDFQGWTPADDPPGSAQDASGSVGAGAVWLRWRQGQMFAVILRTAF